MKKKSFDALVIWRESSDDGISDGQYFYFSTVIKFDANEKYMRDILTFHMPEKERNCRSHWKLRLEDQINLKTSDERDIIYLIYI